MFDIVAFPFRLEGLAVLFIVLYLSIGDDRIMSYDFILAFAIAVGGVALIINVVDWLRNYKKDNSLLMRQEFNEIIDQKDQQIFNLSSTLKRHSDTIEKLQSALFQANEESGVNRVNFVSGSERVKRLEEDVEELRQLIERCRADYKAKDQELDRLVEWIKAR